MVHRRSTWLLPLLITVMASCATGGPRYDGMDADALFQFGMEQLAARKWTEAGEAFERFGLMYGTHPRGQEARFRLGEVYQGRGEWVTAAMEFNRLASDFPAGPWADDARFQVCDSYRELAPRPQLDQQYTLTAIDHCRSLIVYYPDSEYVPRAQEIIEELVDRLAEKDYLVAEGYVRSRCIDCAIIYFEKVAREHPESVWAPRAVLRIYESYQRLGYEQEAEAARQRLLREFPNSPEARQVNGTAAART